MSDQQPHLLVIDDDPDLRNLLSQYFNEQGFLVSCVDGGASLDALEAPAHSFDLVILDIMMPGEDGLSIAKRLRSEKLSPPIIMLSARGDEVDRIVGLEIGADDYIPKPFSPRELLARVRAVLRRNNAVPQSAEDDASILRFGDYQLNLESYSLKKNNEPISLTSGEFQLLSLFLQHPKRVLSRDRLLDWLKGYEHMPYDRSVDVRVTRLRRKIEVDPAKPRWIHTIRGEGYLFDTDGA